MTFSDYAGYFVCLTIMAVAWILFGSGSHSDS